MSGISRLAPPPAVVEAHRVRRSRRGRRITRPLRRAGAARRDPRRRAPGNGLKADTEQVIITRGVHAGLFATLEILSGPGDEVLIPEILLPNYVRRCSPGWPTGILTARADISRELGAEGLITPRTRASMINSPSILTGAVFPEATLRA